MKYYIRATSDELWDKLDKVRKATDEELVKFAQDPSWQVRAAVADVTDDPRLLAKLMRDSEWDVRRRAKRRLESMDL